MSEHQDAVDVINDLWPPDSEYHETASIGRDDMLIALAAEWRSLPTSVLQHMATAQLFRDNHS